MARLHWAHNGCRFDGALLPPWETGTMWSRCSAGLPQYAQRASVQFYVEPDARDALFFFESRDRTLVASVAISVHSRGGDGVALASALASRPEPPPGGDVWRLVLWGLVAWALFAIAVLVIVRWGT